MKKINQLFLFISFMTLFFGCNDYGSQFGSVSSDVVLDEIRSDLLELKHLINNHQIEIDILDEKVVKLSDRKTLPTSMNALGEIDSRIAHLERRQDKISEEMAELIQYGNQTSTFLQQYRDKLEYLQTQLAEHAQQINQIIKLKSTLNQVSKAIENQASYLIHHVQKGESLERIASQYGVSVHHLKKSNGLNKDTIFVGQKLKIPQ